MTARIRTHKEIEGVAVFPSLSQMPSALDFGEGSCIVGSTMYVSNGIVWTNSGAISFSNKIIYLGDSTTAGAILGAQGQSRYLGAMPVCADILSNGLFEVVGYTGQSGFTIRQLNTGLEGFLNNQIADYVVIHAGLNGGVTVDDSAATIISELVALWNRVSNLGYKIIVCTIPPINNISSPNNFKRTGVRNTVNEYIVNQKDYPVADLAKALTDQATGFHRSGATSDGLHPNKRGSYYGGLEIARVLKSLGVKPYTRPLTPFDPYVVNQNHTFAGNVASGTNGASLTTITGTCPYAVAVSVNGPVTGTSVTTTVSGDTSYNTLDLSVAMTGAGDVRIAKFNSINDWTASSTKTIGDLVFPTVKNGYMYKAVSIPSGVTAASQPTWPTRIGDMVVDGTVTWICMPFIKGGTRLQMECTFQVTALTGEFIPQMSLIFTTLANDLLTTRTINMGKEAIQAAAFTVADIPGTGNNNGSDLWPAVPLNTDLTIRSPVIVADDNNGAFIINKFAPSMLFNGLNGSAFTVKVKTLQLRILS